MRSSHKRDVSTYLRVVRLKTGGTAALNLKGGHRIPTAAPRAEPRRTHPTSPLGASAKGPTTAASVCRLCTAPATVTDWRPISDWIMVDGCSCAGYFLWAPIVERVRALAARKRHALVQRIQSVRESGREAWCATTNGEVMGPLVIRASREPT
jgi:hypothetical protein